MILSLWKSRKKSTLLI